MYSVLLCTASTNEAEKIARTLVEEKLSACVNITPEVNSYFRWEGKVTKEKEAMLIIKMETRKVEEVIKRIKELHSYQVPEIIALPIIAGSEEYLAWIKESLK